MFFFKNTNFLIAPITIILYKMKKLYTSKSISSRIKAKITWKQLMFLNLWLVGNIFWIIDNLCFPSYHSIKISKPIFLLGGFRSGTTIIHRSLVQKNENFISPRFLELLFPFLTIQYLFDFLEWLDTNYGSNFISFFDSLLYHFFGKDIMKKHFINFSMPEEDDILLSTYVGIGWYNIVQFPLFDTWKTIGKAELNKYQKEQIQKFYHCCMQKILYRRGKEKQLLNKSHLMLMYPLWKELYPDSKFICIEREQEKAFTSWIELNTFTNQRFFNLNYSDAEYHKFHSQHWKYFEEQKRQIPFSRTIQLEDFCKEPDTELEKIIKELF